MKMAAVTAAAVGSFYVASQLTTADLMFRFLKPVKVDNPLAAYPERDWEKLYRDQYRYDSSFTFVCAPNDTHNCRLRAFVRNGVIVRIEQAYDVAEYQDIYGNKATPTWHPRGCLKGLTFMKRVYSPFRVKYPLVRKGWLNWVNAGFPRDENGRPPKEYFRRGVDDWVRVSWDEAFELVAKAMVNIAQTYSGPSGAELLRRQGYPEEMIEASLDPSGEMAGVRTFKLRGGMAFLGATRLAGMYRFANMLALLDNYLRGKGPEGSVGARTWDNYAWHTDLPPGHPMVHGVQTFDQEFNDFWNSDMLVISGLNLIQNKMADASWWQSRIDKKKKIVVIAPEYSPTATKADYWIGIRPGTDTALMLGLAHVIIREALYKEDFVKKFTDMPLLVREDTKKLLRQDEPHPKPLSLDPGETFVYADGKPVQEMPEELKTYAVMRSKDGRLVGVSRTAVGEHLAQQLQALGLSVDDLELDWKGTVTVKGGETVGVKTIFRLYKELTEEYTPENVEKITNVPKDMLIRLARDIASAGSVGFLCGMGMNMYFHNDLINRAYFLVASLTGNIGKPGGNVGSYAGNYKAPILNLPCYVVEDPFNQTLSPDVDGRDVKKKAYIKFESIHYWNYGDSPLIVNSPKFGRVVLTGKTHMPSPTKLVWAVNANLLGVCKWHYDTIKNVLPKQELYIAQDFEWNMNCEYADVVFPVEAWTELSYPDMTASCTNPFIQLFPKGMNSVHDTKHDIEVYAGVASALAKITGDERFVLHWKFVKEGKVEVYLQRILDCGTTTRGYNIYEMLSAEKGFLALFRTYPRIPGWEQVQESKPFYTRTGRLEFYREEDEFLDQGENLIVHREPMESTPYLPSAIVAPKGFRAIEPKDHGVDWESLNVEEMTVRHVKLTTEEMLKTRNPLLDKDGLDLICITPKPRHRVHSSWSTVDWNVIWASNFGDPYRMDKRTPWVGEEELDINPEDAKERGIKDGDYVYVDGNPRDRPYRGWNKGDPFYKVSRLKIRARYNPSLPRGFTIIYHGIYGATHRSVEAHETKADGLAVTDTGYPPSLRYGSQQSVVRAWLNPTQMTDSLVRKDYFTHKIGKGYLVDVCSVTGAPKESLVKISFAENGSLDGADTWEPAQTGFTPGNESEAMKKYLRGGFIRG